MKKITILCFMLILLSFSVYSQTSSLKVFTDLNDETSYVKVFIDGEPQDAVFNSEVIVEDLYPGKYTLGVSFNSDTIADYIKNIVIKPHTDIVYKVALKGEFGKEAGKMGRSFGQKLGTTDENDRRELVEYYKLVLVGGKE